MANKAYGYQYETSPRKLEPEYKRPPVKKKKNVSQKAGQGKKKRTKKNANKKAKKKMKLSFEIKFFLNSMLLFALVFAIIACQALVEQKYKERENLKEKYNDLLAKSSAFSGLEEDIRIIASQYGMQTKSATLIDLGTSDYIESSVDEVKIEEDGFFTKLINWIKGIF